MVDQTGSGRAVEAAPEQWRHGTVSVDGRRTHYVEQGEGPLVLFIHGFPESWYSWRYQLPVVAAAGYRAVAVDVRGYGRSSAPPEAESYGMLAHVADNLRLVEALGESSAILVGHDWGSLISANSALLRPDVFRAVALLSVPYSPPGGPKPEELFGPLANDESFYLVYFQKPGRAEAEIEADVAEWLAGCYFTNSGDHIKRPEDVWSAMAGPSGLLKEGFTVPDFPLPWLGQTDLDHLVAEFERTGFTGGINHYRNLNRDWEDLQPWAGLPITVPSLYIAGSVDMAYLWNAQSVAAHSETLTDLRKSVILEGCGHWTQQERADEVNQLLLEWLADV